MSEPIFGALNADGTVHEVTISEWIDAFHSTDRVVARTQIGEYLVSTVFLGMDPNFWATDGTPAWFETMVFNGTKPTNYQTRSTTREAAMDEHRRACGSILARESEMVHQIKRTAPTEVRAGIDFPA